MDKEEITMQCLCKWAQLYLFRKKKECLSNLNRTSQNINVGSLRTRDRSCSLLQKSLNPREQLGREGGRRRSSLNLPLRGRPGTPLGDPGAAGDSISLLRRNQGRGGNGEAEILKRKKRIEKKKKGEKGN